MTAARLGRVTAASARVALVTTAIVAAAYVVIAVVVAGIVQHNLTADIDRRLAQSLGDVASHPPPQYPWGGGYNETHMGPRFGPAILVWTIHADGSVTSVPDSTAILPPQFQGVSQLETVSIGGTEVRILGAPVFDDYVVVGQSMSGVSQALSTVVLAEVLVGPVLLACVFLGALTIGRRVAAPIELARQRQMEFAADASHELRTPLSVIEAQTSLALARKRDSEWYRRAFERVEVESGRMRRLVEDLLWLARFDAARTRLGAEFVDLGLLARQAVDRFSAIAEAGGLNLGMAVDGESTVVTAPPEWLDHLMGVLLDNACKYSPEGGRVEVRVASEGGRVRLTVDDSGPGIPAAERPRIFERFHRATESKSGSGLGLAIADAIVKGTGGRWEVGSSPAGGASMSVSWPRSLAGPRPQPAAVRSPAADRNRAGA